MKRLPPQACRRLMGKTHWAEVTRAAPLLRALHRLRAPFVFSVSMPTNPRIGVFSTQGASYF